MRELLNHYMQSDQDRTAAITTVSFVINALLGIGNLFLDVYLFSAWFMVNAAYYLILCIARGQTLRKSGLAQQIEDAKDRYDMKFGVFTRGGVFYACWAFPTCLSACVCTFSGMPLYTVAMPFILSHSWSSRRWALLFMEP